MSSFFFSSRIHLRPIRLCHRPYSSCRISISIPTTTLDSTPKSPTFPVVTTCPTCTDCAPMPEMPPGLEIDHKQPLDGTMAAYNSQVLICTGQRDWASRIENDGDGKCWGELARRLRALMLRGGLFSDVRSELPRPWILASTKRTKLVLIKSHSHTITLLSSTHHLRRRRTNRALLHSYSPRSSTCPTYS